MSPAGARWTWIVPVLLAAVSVVLFLRTAGERATIVHERATLSHVSFDLISIERSLLAIDRALTQTPPAPPRVIEGFLAQGRAALSDLSGQRPIPIAHPTVRLARISRRFGVFERALSHPEPSSRLSPEDRPAVFAVRTVTPLLIEIAVSSKTLSDRESRLNILSLGAFAGLGISLLTALFLFRIGILARRVSHLADRIGTVLDQSESEIYLIDAEGYAIRHANRGALSNQKKSPSELFGSPFPLTVAPGHEADLLSEMEKARGSPNRIFPVEMVLRRADRTTYPVEGTIVFDEKDIPPVLILILRDITYNKIRERIRGLFQSSDEQVLLGDTLESSLETLVRKIGTLLSYPIVQTVLLEPDDAPKTLIAWSEDEANPESMLRTLTRFPDIDPAPRAARSGRPFYTLFLKKGTDPPDWRDFLGTTGIASAYALPLKDPNKPLGAIAFYSRSPEAFQPAECAFLEEIAEQLTLFIRIGRDHERLKLQSVAMTEAANPIMITSRDGRIEWVNDAVLELTGYSERELIGKTPRIFKSGLTPTSVFSDMWNTILSGWVWEGEILNRRKDGSQYPIEAIITPILDSKGQVVRFVSTLQNIADKKEAEEKIRHMAQHDVLTGLPNRLLFKDRLQQAISRAKRSDESLAVLFFDLDRFKEINDSQGHEVGDQLLIEVSRRVRGMLRETDTLSRFGGDEFVVIQTDVHSKEDSEILAKRILGQFLFPFSVGEQMLRTSASIGITLCPQDDTDPDQLLRNADLAMYKAKAEGRNNFCFYEHHLKSRVEARIVLEDKLRGVVGWEDFELHYQPQIDVRSDKILRVEALARWKHPVDGFISPSQFIPIAEETGLILTLGEWVLKTALAQAAAWEREGLPTPIISVNVSARQFDHPDFVDLVKRSVAEFGDIGRKLELELTESMVMKAPEQAGEALRSLKDLGVNALIDDFGTGYSSLAYLTRFPIQAIKIDRSFVKDLDADRHAQTIVRAIISLAHGLGISVVGEGVETLHQKEILIELGCDALQGFLIGAPMPAEELTRILKGEDRLPGHPGSEGDQATP